MMKKGKVNANMIYLKRGGYVHKGETVSSEDVDSFEQLVDKGLISVKKVDKEVDDNSELMKLKKDELQTKCLSLNIPFEESETKAELVAKIEQAEKQNG